MLNIGGIDYNVDDQYARDVIAHSENGLDSQSNLPVSSRHYDEGDYLIGQDRFYYEAITDIEIGDTLVVGVNLRQTILSDEIVRLKNQSSLAVIQCIAFNEVGTTASKDYAAGQYLYWDYGLDAGLYETITAITSGDSFSVGVNIKSANKIMDIVDGLQDSYNITGAKNLCPNWASDTVVGEITYDILSDGSIQVSGNAPAAIRIKELGHAVLAPGTYVLTTGQETELNSQVTLYAKPSSEGPSIANSGSRQDLTPYFTLSQSTDIIFRIATFPDGTAVNTRIYPMCRVASVTDETYVPYAMTNSQLTSQISNFTKLSSDTKQISSTYGTGNFTFYKIGRVVTVSYDFTLSADANQVDLLTVSNEFIPIMSINSVATPYNTSSFKKTGDIYLNTDGKIRMYAGLSGIRYLNSFAYISAS